MKTKTVNFCNSVRFQLQETWSEEYSADGSGAFFDRREYLGTLRLDVLDYDFKPDSASADLSPKQHLEASAHRKQLDCRISELTRGTALSYRVESTISEGDACQMHWWEVGIAVTSLHRRIAMFSYTIPVSLAALDSGRDIFAFLDHSIRTADYPH